MGKKNEREIPGFRFWIRLILASTINSCFKQAAIVSVPLLLLQLLGPRRLSSTAETANKHPTGEYDMEQLSPKQYLPV